MKNLIIPLFVLFVFSVPVFAESNNNSDKAKRNVVLSEKTENNDDNDDSDDTEAKFKAKNLNAQENMSIVAQKVHEILENRETKGGIGEQVRVIAQEQNRAQEQTSEQLERFKNTNIIKKSIFGPNYKAIRSLTELIEMNETRIEKLQEISKNITNPEDKEEIDAIIKALMDQNISLRQEITSEEKVSSVFGWLIQLLNK